MGCECARLRMKEEIEKKAMTRSVGVQADELALTEDADTPLHLKSNQIRRLNEPISAFYQILPQTSSKSSLVQAQVLSTGQTCVLRVLSKDKVMGGFAKRTVANLLAQISSFAHPSIVRPLELLEDNVNFYISYPFLVPLLSHLSSQPSMPESIYASILWQLLSALSFAYNHQCLHTALDLDCIFLRSNSASTPIDICVSGFEKQLEGKRARISAFDAPEIMHKGAGDKADVWSCGIIMYNLLWGTTPFHPIKYTAMVAAKKTMRVTKPKGVVSDEAWDLLHSMLQWNPEQRPSVAQCLLHPWVTQVQGSLPSVPSKVVKNMLHTMGKSQPRSILRDAIKHYIVFKVEKTERLDDMTAMFRLFDTNSDGVISESELISGLRRWMPQDKAVAKAKQVMQVADKDSSGYIDYSEFLLSSLNEELLLCNSNLLEAFNSFDKDQSGKLSISELRDVFALCANGERRQGWAELMREIDKNGDEEIDFKEFRKLMQGE